jgi:hypothetical protein
MRIGCAALLAVAAVAVPAAGAAGRSVTVTLSASASKVLYGHGLTLTGRAVGTKTGSAVTLFARVHGTSAPVRVAVADTRAGGLFSFSVRPSKQTAYTASAAAVSSAKVVVGVAPRLSIAELGDGRIAASVEPSHVLARRFLELEQLQNGVWRVIRKSRLSQNGTTAFAPLPPSQSSPVRLALSVNQAGAGYLGSTSHALAYRAFDLTLAPDADRVSYGSSTVLRGRLWNGESGQRIAIVEWVFGRPRASTLAHVVTGTGGRWRLRVTPRIQTTYQARWTLHASPRERVGVAPAITVTRVARDEISTHVSAGRSYAGQTVAVQRLMSPGVWQKIGQGDLDRTSSALFRLAIPASTIRIALSVNEAGAGYLASFSRPLHFKP